MKIRTPFENAKYFEVSYDPTFYDTQLPIIEINDDEYVIKLTNYKSNILPVIGATS